MIFYLTAATYAEATTMYPEAGGSSSFARRAFNEFWSFFAAWGQMLNYTITIAISSFFVPHYIGGLFWGELRHGPGDIVAGVVIVVALSAINVVGVKEAAGLNIALAVTDFATQLLLVLVGLFLVFSPHTLIDNVQLGVAPTWKDFFLAIPVGMIAYTGIETISNMAEEAKDVGKTVPAAIKRVVIAVFAIYALLPAVALSALPVTQTADGTYQTKLGLPEDQGGFAGDPILGVVKQLNLGIFQHAGEIYVGLLAATILFIATNAGIIGVSRLVYSMGLHRQLPDAPAPAAPEVPHAVDRDPPVRRHRLRGDHPGQGRRSSGTCTRSARCSRSRSRTSRSSACARPSPTSRGPTAGRATCGSRGRDLPLFAVLGGLGTAIAFVTVTALHPDVAIAGIALAGARDRSSTSLFRRSPGPRPREHRQGRGPQAGRRPRGRVRLGARRLRRDRLRPGDHGHGARLAARRRRGIHVLVPITVPWNAPIAATRPSRR